MRNEYKVPLSRCRRCKKYKYGYCDKQDLEPCAFVSKKNKAPYFFKLREIKTGRVFFAEWSNMAGEWYEAITGKPYQTEDVEIIE